MNAERLHAIAQAIRDDFQATNLVEQLQQLRDALQNQVNAPQQAEYQQQVSDQLQALATSLAQAPSNEFPPTWQQLLQEIGAADVMGSHLMEQIRGVFERNQITPSVAHQEIAQFHERVARLDEAIDKLLAALDQLGIGAEELEPGQCELGILVPRAAVRNKLEDFGEELTLLNKTLGVFSELATGSRPDLDIRGVSSTDFQVFLDLAPQIGACLVVAVERLVSLYKQLLEIRVLRAKLADEGVPDANLEGVDTHANAHMSSGIADLVEELLRRYGERLPPGRRAEVETELTISLNRLANRIDKGYNVEVRVEPLVSEDEEVPKDVDPSDRQAIDAILAAAPKLQFLKPAGEPILTLPEPDDEDDA